MEKIPHQCVSHGIAVIDAADPVVVREDGAIDEVSEVVFRGHLRFVYILEESVAFLQIQDVQRPTYLTSSNVEKMLASLEKRE